MFCLSTTVVRLDSVGCLLPSLCLAGVYVCLLSPLRLRVLGWPIGFLEGLGRAARGMENSVLTCCLCAFY